MLVNSNCYQGKDTINYGAFGLFTYWVLSHFAGKSEDEKKK